MKRVKIFLASSIEDLQTDRLQIGDFFRQLNELYLDSGIHFSLIKCEDYDQSISDVGKQQQYDREIRESELVFFLFFRKVGDYTRHELEVALEAFKNQKKPRIVTYFKYINTLEETVQEVRDFMHLLDHQLKHYYNIYGHIDTLKLGILMQIKLLQLDSAQIKLEDGAVQLNGQTVVKAENVPLLQGNQSLQELMQKRRQLQAALTRCRSDYLADPTPEKEMAFFDASAELNRVSKQLTAVERETMGLLTTVAEMTTDGRVLTHRQKEALHHFNLGNYAAVHTILENEERENELRCAQLRAEAAKDEIQGYVEEELLLIKTEKVQGLTDARVKRILSSYQKVAELVETYDLNRIALCDYASFLYEQNRFAEAISVAEKLDRYYADHTTTVKDEEIAKLSHLMSVFYQSVCCYQKAEPACRKAIEIRTCLATQNPEVYEPHLASSYMNMGNLYWATHRYTLAEIAYDKGVEIYTRLAKCSPEIYEPYLASSYNNQGALYCDTQRYQDAVEVYRKAIEIRTRLANCDPEAHESELAKLYNNRGSVYLETKCYQEAEEDYGKAIEICTRLVNCNPEAHKPALAMYSMNMGNVYRAIQRYEEAEGAYRKSFDIYAPLAEGCPDTYEPELAKCHINQGYLYWEVERFEEADAAFQKALEIFMCLAKQRPDDYGMELANTYTRLILHYAYAKHKRKKALLKIVNAVQPCFDDLVKKDPARYMFQVMRICNALKEICKFGISLRKS